MSLLQTKLHAPTVLNRNGRFSHISRPRLLQKLNLSFGKKLTLICAPAGFGKSTLLSEWIAQSAAAGVELTHGARIPCAAAWLSLDAGDNDAIRFWTYFVAALQTLDAEIGKTTLAALQSPQSFSPEVILTSLLNDVAERPDLLLLVLDDYHLIKTPAIHKALLFLLDHLPPQLHIVLSSRADPPLTLARWRGQGLLTELRIDDLRFTAEEAAGFLKEVMGLDLSPAAIAALDSRTEGWIAGLQLAALSLQGMSDRDKFIDRFSGSNRYIVDYLVEEVLAQQPAEIHTFLLRSSILEQLSGPLCDAVVGHLDESSENGAASSSSQGISSQEILETLEQANLFLIPLDNERTWFRYHHLFADVLRLRLRKEHANLIPRLHHQASLWYEANGQVEAAVSHALAIPDVERAAFLVESIAMSIMLRYSEMYSARRLMEQIPLDVIYTRPRLILYYGIGLTLFGEFERVYTLLSTTAATLQSQDVPADVTGGVLMLRSLLARLRAQPEESLDLAQKALEILPVDQFAFRAAAIQNIGMAYLRRGESAEGIRLLSETVALSIAGKAIYLALVAYEESATEQLMIGQLTQSKRTCDEALSQAARWDAQFLPAVGIIHIVRGEILCEWNDFAGAAHSLSEGIELVHRTTEMNLLARGIAALARIQTASGEIDTALATLQRGEERLERMQIEASFTLNARARMGAQRATLQLRQGEIDAAQRWAATTILVGDTSHGCAQRHALVRLRLAQYQRDPQPHLLQEANQLLAHVLKVAESKHWLGYRIENLLLQALLYHAQRERAAAQDALLHALTLGQPEGYIRTFVDEGEAIRVLLIDVKLGLARKTVDEEHEGLSAYIDKLLAALGPAQPAADRSSTQPHPAAQMLVEPLTEREIEILRLVENGLSNNEIADKLIVTVGTVKKHLNNIFGKLGVSSRTQALVSARAVNLL